MTNKEFQNIVHKLPQEPGIYKYYASSGELLYVGKAKNIRKRVSSYFTKSNIGYKTLELINRVAKIEFTIVDTEQDAFLLENALIKEYQPKFNILLKDDKTYPYIVIKKEPFPRVFLTRRKLNDGSEYLGPFTSVSSVRDLLQFIKTIIPLRTCTLNLSSTQIQKGKYKVCLEYHLGNCKGPCEALQTEQEYMQSIQEIRDILKGNLSKVIQHYKNELQKCIQELAFEKAAIIKKKLDQLNDYQSKSVVVSKTVSNVDVFSMYRDEYVAYINYLMVRNSNIVQTHTTEIHIPLEESDEDVLTQSILQLRNLLNSTAKEIVVNLPLEAFSEDIIITVPKAGEKKKLLELSQKNVLYFKSEIERKKKLNLNKEDEFQHKKILLELKEQLQLKELPVHIECFDNSNFQGAYPVSAMVCFKNGVPSKKDYRHFKVQSVEGINDFATMEEVVFRRYKRLKEENADLPQLVIIDGGKGQLNAAIKAINNLSLSGRMTLVGLAKHEEEIFFSGDQQALKLDWNSNALKLVRRIRDEVHRFGITFHRHLRSKGTFTNELEKIKGIGPKTAEQLLKKYKSVKKISTVQKEELIQEIGLRKAKILLDHFNGQGKKKGPE